VGHFCADFILMHKLYKSFLKDAAYEIPLYLDHWFMRKRALNVFPYISLFKMKRPLAGPVLGGFYFYVLRMMYIVYQIAEECFLKFTKFNPFLGPLI